MHKWIRIVGIIVLLLLLVLVRANESLFNDPFIAYFKLDYLSATKPNYDFWTLFISHSIRYDINAIISLGLLYFIFLDRSILKFSLVIYIIVFLLLFPIYYFSLSTLDNDSYQFTFYVRRFLIQPLLVFNLIPAFYYQKVILTKN